MGKPLIYNWSVEKYVRLVPPLIKEQASAEIDSVLNIDRVEKRIVIDVGAGYGRILPDIAPKVKSLIAIEINQLMFDQLKKRSQQYKNVTPIQGDANKLSTLLEKANIIYPVIICFQNSLGTWEGDPRKAISEMKDFAKKRGGEIIISVFNQKALRTKGIQLYTNASELVGQPDINSTDFERGIFRSKSGYVSRWRTDDEIEKMSQELGGKVRKIEGPYFTILHAKY